MQNAGQKAIVQCNMKWPPRSPDCRSEVAKFPGGMLSFGALSHHRSALPVVSWRIPDRPFLALLEYCIPFTGALLSRTTPTPPRGSADGFHQHRRRPLGLPAGCRRHRADDDLPRQHGRAIDHRHLLRAVVWTHGPVAALGSIFNASFVAAKELFNSPKP